MIVAIGEILFDVYPKKRYLGGAPFNFIYHLKKLGMPVCLVTRVGDDADGRAIFEVLEANDFNTDFVQVDPHKKTGQVLTELDGEGIPRFNILADAAYDYIELDPSLEFASPLFFGRSCSGTRRI